MAGYRFTRGEKFFDQLVVHHRPGPLLAEDHYYPFGLEMGGISDQAALKPENFFKYNGKELQHKEFSDGSGLEEYDYCARFYDPQIGRFGTIDKFSEKYTALSPYQYCMDNPMRFVDLHGDSIIISKLLTENFIANEAFNNFCKIKTGYKIFITLRKGRSSYRWLHI